MRFTEKVNLLLQQHSPEQILTRLRNSHAVTVEQHEQMLVYE